MPLTRTLWPTIAAAAAIRLVGCGGTATSSVGSTDPSAGASSSADRGGTSGQTGLGGSNDLGGASSGSGGASSGSGGTQLFNFHSEAGIQAIFGDTGPGGPCAFTSMTCDALAAMCTCDANATGTGDRSWTCDRPVTSFHLPSQTPSNGGDCRTEGQACTGWTICSPTCTCEGGKWACVPPKDCVVPSCTGLDYSNGSSCTYLGLRCGGGCGSCTCEPTADGSLQWVCVYFPC